MKYKSAIVKGTYNPAFVRLFSIIVRINNRCVSLKRRLRVSRMVRKRGRLSDYEIIGMLEEMIPEIKQYKRPIVLYQTCLLAHDNGFTDLEQYLHKISTEADALLGKKSIAC